jgi:MFS family permease
MLSAPTGPLGFRSTLRSRYFRQLWIAQIISQTIQNASNYGAVVLLTQQSHSFTAAGGVIIAFSLPAALFSVPAGVLVDRIDKRLLLWLSNLLRALASFGFVLFILNDPHNYLPIYLLTFFVAIVGQFFAPAEGASIPLLVRPGELISALSLFNVTFSIAQALGYVILGPAILLGMPTLTIPFGSRHVTFGGVHWLFLTIGLLYLICAILTWSIPAKRLEGELNPSGKQLRSMWHGIAEAWTYVSHRRAVLISIGQLTLGGVAITVIATVAPLFSVDFLNRPPALAAIVFVPAGLGLVLGSIMMPRFVTRLGLAISEGLGVVGVAACVLLLTFARWTARQIYPTNWQDQPLYLLAIVILIFGIGLGLDLINLPAQTALQQRSPDWIKGRILALQQLLLNAAAIPSILVIGVLADRLGLSPSMALMALAVAALGLLSIYAETSYQRVGPQPTPKPSAQDDADLTFKGAHSNPLSQIEPQDAETAPHVSTQMDETMPHPRVVRRPPTTPRQ